MKIKKSLGVVLALVFFVIGSTPGVFANDSCNFKYGRYFNLDYKSKNFKKCVKFGSRCTEKGSDDCDKTGRNPLRCNYKLKKCEKQKQNGASCKWPNECISHSCNGGSCGKCSSDDDCANYHVIGTKMDFKKYPCVRGKCFIPFEPH